MSTTRPMSNRRTGYVESPVILKVSAGSRLPDSQSWPVYSLNSGTRT